MYNIHIKCIKTFIIKAKVERKYKINIYSRTSIENDKHVKSH